jgi:hypothetical protein
MVDLYNVQAGTGADLTAFTWLRPWSRLTLELLAARRWLDVPAPGGGKGACSPPRSCARRPWCTSPPAPTFASSGSGWGRRTQISYALQR